MAVKYSKCHHQDVADTLVELQDELGPASYFLVVRAFANRFGDLNGRFNRIRFFDTCGFDESDAEE